MLYNSVIHKLLQEKEYLPTIYMYIYVYIEYSYQIMSAIFRCVVFRHFLILSFQKQQYRTLSVMSTEYTLTQDWFKEPIINQIFHCSIKEPDK